MTAQQMKQIKVDEVLLDTHNSNKLRKAITCLVIEVKKEGVLVRGYDSQSSDFYYNELTGKKDELIPWDKAYSVELIDPARVNEPGYLPY